MNSQRIARLAGVTVCISLMFFITPTQGANIVIGGNTTDIGTIIFVSPNPGDLPTDAGTALRNTLDAITNNSASNPYLIKVGPGIYDIGTSSLQMKPYVDIEGSGENTTIIQGSISYTDLNFPIGVVNGASNAEIRFLTINRTGGGTYAIAMCNKSVAPKLTHVTIKISGASGANSGVYNDTTPLPHPAMTNVTILATGGGFATGMFNNLSSPTMTAVNITAMDASTSSGFRGANSSPTMTHVTISASEGVTYSYGVYTYGSSGTTTINHSVISGTTAAIANGGTGVTTYVGSTQLVGGATNAGGTLICAGVYDGSYVFHMNTCQ